MAYKLYTTTAIAEEQEAIDKLFNENSRATDIYVFLYEDGTLTFGMQNEPIEGKTVLKEYGNIKEQKYNSWSDENGNLFSNTPWFEDNVSIRKVSIVDEIVPQTMANWFFECENMNSIENIERIDTSEVEDMRGMFAHCTKLSIIYVGDVWDLSNVETTTDMFARCGTNTTTHKGRNS